MDAWTRSPPTGRRLVYREGDHTADGLMRAVVTGKTLAEAYGLTETSPAVCINPLDLQEFNHSGMVYLVPLIRIRVLRWLNLR